jgi:hypothetical protein
VYQVWLKSLQAFHSYAGTHTHTRTRTYIYSHVYQVWLKSLQAFHSYAGTHTHTHAHTHIYIYIYIYIYIVICVPSLVEIARGVPELCWNIHTDTHASIFIYIDSQDRFQSLQRSRYGSITTSWRSVYHKNLRQQVNRAY